MSNKYRYSIARKDKKVAGVCARLGDWMRIDPTFIRIAFAATFLFIKWELAIVAYLAAGIYFHVQDKKAGEIGRRRHRSDYERMELSGSGRGRSGSVHDALNKLDVNDRRMMAIDHHLHSAESDALAREIEALRAKPAVQQEEK